MNEVALFERALRAAVPTQPDPSIADQFVPRLAGIAQAATIAAETRPARRGIARRSGSPRRSRRRLAARVGIAVAAIPLAFAGLAFAGVTVPGPARDAFDSVGITLPNQPSEKSEQGASPRSQGGNDVSDAAKTKDPQAEQGNSVAAHQHAREQRSKARGEAKGHTLGKAIGLNELTPPGQSGDTGTPDHSQAGGSARSQSAGPPPPANVDAFPGSARGHSTQLSHAGPKSK